MMKPIAARKDETTLRITREEEGGGGPDEMRRSMVEGHGQEEQSTRRVRRSAGMYFEDGAGIWPSRGEHSH